MTEEQIPNLGQCEHADGTPLINIGTGGEFLFSLLGSGVRPYSYDKEQRRWKAVPKIWTYNGEDFTYAITEEEYKRLNVRANGIPWSMPDVLKGKAIEEGYEILVRGWGWEGEGEFLLCCVGGEWIEADKARGSDTSFYLEIVPSAVVTEEPEDYTEKKEIKRKMCRKAFAAWFQEITGEELKDSDGDKYSIFVQLAKNLKN